MWIWGGGHQDSPDASLYAVNFSGTPGPARIFTTYPNNGCSQASCDGGVTPNARHTYDILTYVANIDSFLSYGGALSASGSSTRDLWLYHFATQTWERKFPTGTSPIDAIGPVEYDPVTGRVYFWDNQNLIYWDPMTNAFTALYTNSSGFTNTTSGVLDPVNRKIILWGGGTPAW